MDVSPSSTSSYFPCREVTWKMIFCMTFYNCFLQKWHDGNHKGVADAARSYSTNSYTFKDGYGTGKLQYMSLHVAHHTISSEERVSKIWHFTWNLRAVFGTNDMVWTTRCLYMLSAPPLIKFIHLRKVTKHSNSNGCLSLYHIIPFHVQLGCPKSYILPLKV